MENKPLTVENVIKTEADGKKLIEAIAHRTSSFLMEEVSINTLQTNYEIDKINKLELKYLTSIIVVEDDVKLTLAFSFEKKLIENIFKEYSKGIEIDDDEVQIYVEETAGDMINIVMGNVLSYFQQFGKTILISSPIIINGAKSISRYKDSRFYSIDISTDNGEMVIYCITPGEKIISHLENGRREKDEKYEHSRS